MFIHTNIKLKMFELVYHHIKYEVNLQTYKKRAITLIDICMD